MPPKLESRQVAFSSVNLHRGYRVPRSIRVPPNSNQPKTGLPVLIVAGVIGVVLRQSQMPQAVARPGFAAPVLILGGPLCHPLPVQVALNRGLVGGQGFDAVPRALTTRAAGEQPVSVFDVQRTQPKPRITWTHQGTG